MLHSYGYQVYLKFNFVSYVITRMCTWQIYLQTCGIMRIIVSCGAYTDQKFFAEPHISPWWMEVTAYCDEDVKKKL